MTGNSLSTAKPGKLSKNKIYTYNSNMNKKDLGKYTKDQLKKQKPKTKTNTK